MLAKIDRSDESNNSGYNNIDSILDFNPRDL
jgi:hypothetical protein